MEYDFFYFQYIRIDIKMHPVYDIPIETLIALLLNKVLHYLYIWISRNKYSPGTFGNNNVFSSWFISVDFSIGDGKQGNNERRSKLPGRRVCERYSDSDMSKI